MSWRHRQLEMFDDAGEYECGLLQGEGRSDARASTGAKGQISKAINLRPRFANEARRIEFVWPMPQQPMSVQNVGRNHDHRTRSDWFSGKIIGADCYTTDCGDR